MTLPSIENRKMGGKNDFLTRVGKLGQLGVQVGVFEIKLASPEFKVDELPAPSLVSPKTENNIPLLSATTVSRAEHVAPTAIEVQPGRVLSKETYNYADAVDAMFAQAFLAK